MLRKVKQVPLAHRVLDVGKREFIPYDPGNSERVSIIGTALLL